MRASVPPAPRVVYVRPGKDDDGYEVIWSHHRRPIDFAATEKEAVWTARFIAGQHEVKVLNK